MDKDEEKFLPKEPLDLPLPALPVRQAGARQSFPAPHKEGSPAHHVSHDPSRNTHELRTLLSWSAPGRPFRKKRKEYFLTAGLIILFLEVIAFLFSQYLLMMVILSVGFLAFTLAIVPPKNFHYKISTQGITIEDHFYLWGELYDFYFKKRDGEDILHITTHAFIPGELTLTLGDIHREHVKSAMIKYLPYREFVRPNFMERSGDWLARNFPLERTSH